MKVLELRVKKPCASGEELRVSRRQPPAFGWKRKPWSDDAPVDLGGWARAPRPRDQRSGLSELASRSERRPFLLGSRTAFDRRRASCFIGRTWFGGHSLTRVALAVQSAPSRGPV